MNSATPLRAALWANAAFSTASGSLALATASDLSQRAGLPSELIWGLGPALVLFGAGLTVIATRRPIPVTAAATATALDLAWVAGSTLLIVARPVPHPSIVVVPALVVLTLAVAQLAGLARLRRASRASDRTRQLRNQ